MGFPRTSGLIHPEFLHGKNEQQIFVDIPDDFFYKNKISSKTGAINVKKYTYSAKQSDIEGKWWIVDAEGMVLGRLATVIASRIRGKHNPLFTPHVDTGDSVIVINAEKIVLTGRKMEQKKYYRHSGYIGGLKTTSAREMLERKPQEMIRLAVKGMLPKNRLGYRLIQKLKVYAGNQHPHVAQKPEVLELQ